MKNRIKNVIIAGLLSLPLSTWADWTENLNFKGDLRLRYESQNWDVPEKEDRSRFRLRYRLNVDGTVAENIKIKAGLISGGADPRSPYQTFQDSFSTKEINLNFAYINWKASENVNFLAGKIEKLPLWLASDLLWDTDITPEGFCMAINLNDIAPDFNLFINLGAFILDEYSNTEDDPYMYTAQIGIQIKLPGNMFMKLAASYYAPSEIVGTTLDFSSGGNTLITQGQNQVLTFEYKVPVASMEFGQKDLSYAIPYWSLFGDYASNPDPDDNETAYLAGIKFGHEKLKTFMQWQIILMKRYLESDAWLDIFPDSSTYGGKTGVEGVEAVLNLSIGENTTLGLDYYQNEFLEGDPKTEDIFQMDLTYKF